MNWDELKPEIRDAVNDHLTSRQAQAFVLAIHGLSLGQIGRAMSISPSTARIHLDAATRNLLDAGVRFHPNGEPYTRETQ